MLVATAENGSDAPAAPAVFPFRPWVGRAGLSIVLTSLGVTVAVILLLLLHPRARYGWIGEPFVWAYLGVLWIGGLKVWLGARRPVAEIGETVTLRPLHQLRGRTISMESVAGTEQMIGGDRLMIYFETPRGLRFVALNLNLVKGRRELLALLDERLRAKGFVEKVVDRSRYLSRPT